MTPELRELLELSAKAMGYEVFPEKETHHIIFEHDAVLISREHGDPVWWFPHLDKAQCFGMECALVISVAYGDPADAELEAFSWLVRKPGVAGLLVYDAAIERLEDHDNDRAKARAMAVLRVAAEIGRRMTQ